MTRFFCIFALMILALPAFGHMTEPSDGSWWHLADADRKPHHDDYHWHISHGGQQESAWSRCVNQPGVYDESTGEYDFRKCDKEDPPGNTEQTNPTPEVIQTYDEYVDSITTEPTTQGYTEYLDSIAPKPEFQTQNQEEPRRYSINISWNHRGGSTRYGINVDVHDQDRNRIKNQRVTISCTGSGTNFSSRQSRNSGNPITIRTGDGDPYTAGVITTDLTGGYNGGEYTVTASMDRDGQNWSRSLTFTWDNEAGNFLGGTGELPDLRKDDELPEYVPEDVNRDGVIDNDDLTAIANNLGAAPKGDIQGYDVDGDGDIDTADFQQVLNSVEANAAPAARSLTEPETILEHIKQLPQIAPPPRVTALLPNYPNPFNPETWIPYHLANDAEVILTIYAANGKEVRVLDLGHRTAGNYQHRAKAAYWDGRDALGFPVSSGVYFYSLSAGNFSATRKMLIAK